MPIAKTYESNLIKYINEPYAENKKQYVDILMKCPRCGGTGNYSFNPLNGTTCFQCHGSKAIIQKVRYYTESQFESMEKAAEKKKEKKENEKLAAAEFKKQEWISKNGFTNEEDPCTWIFLGDTYPIKDELKALGAKFSYLLGWHIGIEKEDSIIEVDGKEYEIKTLPVFFSDLYQFNNYGFAMELPTAAETIKQIRDAAAEKTSKSQHIGKIGQKLIDYSVEVTSIIEISTRFGLSSLILFKDEEGNVLNWMTSTIQDIKKNEKVLISGTIKSHEIYKDVKNTVLTRCKLKKRIS